MKSLLILFGRIVGKVFPSKTISSFLGVGYLPSWQSYWSAFLALFTVDMILILTYGSRYLLYATPSSGMVVAAILMKIAVGMLGVQIIAILILHAQDPSANSGESIVIQIASGQILTVACSMPAIISIYYCISKFYGDICKQILQCPIWFNDFMHFVFLLMIPYIFFNIIEVIKPWPISSIQLGYNNAISITLEGIVQTFYAIILLYLTAFIFCELTISSAIAFNTSVIQHVQENLLAFKDYLYSIL